MKMKRIALLAALVIGTAAYGVTAERFYRPARYTRDNTNLVKLQPIDSAKWIWHPGDDRMADGARGTVATPVPGTFVFGGTTRELHRGVNRID